MYFFLFIKQILSSNNSFVSMFYTLTNRATKINIEFSSFACSFFSVLIQNLKVECSD